jgi:hypothetical protein
MAQRPVYVTPGGNPPGQPFLGTGRKPPPGMAIQGKVNRVSDDLSDRYLCSRCAIRYEVSRGAQAHCPLCAAERQLEDLMRQVDRLTDENIGLSRKLEAVAVQMDHITAIREAMPLVTGDDMVFLKQVMYLYRDDRSYSLTALNGRIATDRRGRVAKKQPVRNALLLSRGGREPEEHLFSSIGGVAIVGYFDEMTREVGEKQAMVYLLRAVSLYLSKAE